MADSTAYSLPALQAIATFHQAVSVQKQNHSGPEHFGYLPTIEGVAYFGTNEWQPGTVFYDGILYQNEWLKYDLVKDKLVLKRFDDFAIELRGDKVAYFTMPGHTFINVNDSAKTGLQQGFYDRLSSGALTILARHEKKFDEKAEGTILLQRFLEKTSYYAIKNDRSFAIRNQASVLVLLDDKKGEVQQYLKKTGIRFRKNPELALITIADYCNKTRP